MEIKTMKDTAGLKLQEITEIFTICETDLLGINNFRQCSGGQISCRWRIDNAYSGAQ